VLSGDGDEWELERALELVRSRRLRSDANADPTFLSFTLHQPHVERTCTFLFHTMRSKAFAFVDTLILQWKGNVEYHLSHDNTASAHHNHNRRIKTAKHNCLIAPLLSTYTWLASIGIWNLKRKHVGRRACHADPTHRTQNASSHAVSVQQPRV
jgi:hypothetical protein